MGCVCLSENVVAPPQLGLVYTPQKIAVSCKERGELHHQHLMEHRLESTLLRPKCLMLLGCLPTCQLREVMGVCILKEQPLLGRGTFGTVLAGTIPGVTPGQSPSHWQVAVKVFKREFGEGSPEELSILARLHCK
jgi:hypothetical protein